MWPFSRRKESVRIEAVTEVKHPIEEISHPYRTLGKRVTLRDEAAQRINAAKAREEAQRHQAIESVQHLLPYVIPNIRKIILRAAEDGDSSGYIVNNRLLDGYPEDGPAAIDGRVMFNYHEMHRHLQQEFSKEGVEILIVSNPTRDSGFHWHLHE